MWWQPSLQDYCQSWSWPRTWSGKIIFIQVSIASSRSQFHQHFVAVNFQQIWSVRILGMFWSNLATTSCYIAVDKEDLGKMGKQPAFRHVSDSQLLVQIHSFTTSMTINPHCTAISALNSFPAHLSTKHIVVSNGPVSCAHRSHHWPGQGRVSVMPLGSEIPLSLDLDMLGGTKTCQNNWTYT